MNPLLDCPPSPVLAHFRPHTDGLTWQRVPGGFSGASVWRGSEGDSPRIALKAWPTGTLPERVQHVHAWLAKVAHLPFAPEVYASPIGRSVCVETGRVWDCSRWMPGTPRLAPSATEVSAACEVVAKLHAAWAGESRRGACPGVRNRLRLLTENESLLRKGPDTLPPVSPQLDSLLRRAMWIVARLAPAVLQELRPWEHREFALQPCVRDLRAEHVLFEGDRVSAIIDYGATSVDSPAVDLARLLGDWAPADEPLFAVGLSAYRAARPSLDAPDDFIRLLTRTGLVCSLLGWLTRLVVRREHPAEPPAVAARIEALLSRIEQFTHF